MTPAAPNLLVISDLHLGEHLRAEAERERADHTESALVEFLDWHTRFRDDERPWHLVINGDMVDFVAIRLMPDDVRLSLGTDAEEHAYGLDDGPVGAVAKMRAVLRHHDEVFRAMARFVGAGNQLSLVIGNHDAAFHWQAVQEVFRRGLADLWSAEPASDQPGARTRAELLEAIEFNPWFFFEEGVAWIEHGHQFDPYCSFEDVVAPDTDESRRIDLNIGSSLMRYVGNHYLSDMEQHWGRGFVGYLAFWVSQGLGRAAGILKAYADMCAFLFRVWWERRPQRVAARKARNRERLARIAAKARLPLTLLLRLSATHLPPATVRIDDIVRAIMLDRLILVFSLPVLVIGFVVFQPDPLLGGLAAAAYLGPLATLSARPRDPVDPRAAMRRVSLAIRRMVRVPIVVFGHSHTAVAEEGQDGWYFNTGSWVGDPRQAFTHLRVLRTPAGPVARLYQWRDGAVQVLAPAQAE